MRYTSVSDLTQEEAINWLYEQKNVDFETDPTLIEECNSFFVKVELADAQGWVYEPIHYYGNISPFDIYTNENTPYQYFEEAVMSGFSHLHTIYLDKQIFYDCDFVSMIEADYAEWVEDKRQAEREERDLTDGCDRGHAMRIDYP
jgi:hypothetical protein